ncbi:Uncharacterised protein [uncultured archaeon]|nr:Uncharacterised protein [uncultured archaeon]
MPAESEAISFLQAASSDAFCFASPSFAAISPAMRASSSFFASSCASREDLCAYICCSFFCDSELAFCAFSAASDCICLRAL